VSRALTLYCGRLHLNLTEGAWVVRPGRPIRVRSFALPKAGASRPAQAVGLAFACYCRVPRENTRALSPTETVA